MGRVLVLTEVFPPRVGGSGRWLYELYRRLPVDAVIVAAGEAPGQEQFDCAQDLPIFRMPLSLPSWGLLDSRARRGHRLLRQRVGRIIHEEQVTALHCGKCLPEGLVGMWFWLIRGISYTCYVHGEELTLAEGSRELRWLTRVVLRHASRVIANSHNTRQLLVERWMADSGKVVVLHPGVDTTRFVPARLERGVRMSLGWGTRPVVLTVGRLQARKGHDRMIEALPAIRKSVPDVLYAIVGEGEERDSLEACVDRFGVRDHVQFLGALDDLLTVACYQQCDLFVLPNRQEGSDIEGFGMVLLEAQACGKPVVAGDSGGTAETMDVGVTGLVIDCKKPELLARTVADLLLDTARRERFGQAARRMVVERFDWGPLTRQAGSLFGLDSDPEFSFGIRPVMIR